MCFEKCINKIAILQRLSKEEIKQIVVMKLWFTKEILRERKQNGKRTDKDTVKCTL